MTPEFTFFKTPYLSRRDTTIQYPFIAPVLNFLTNDNIAQMAISKSWKNKALGILFQRIIKHHNYYRMAKFSFPSLVQINQLSSAELKEVWHDNNLSLMGLLAFSQLPHFGLHGTPRGVPGIVHSKLATLFRATFLEASTSPITFLADLYAITLRALNYSRAENDSEGGVLVLSSEKYAGTKTYEKSIFECTRCEQPEFRCLPFLKINTDNQNNFLSLFHRKHFSPLLREDIMRITPENYADIVKGIITFTNYPLKMICEPSLTEEELLKKQLIAMMRIQEKIVLVLNSLQPKIKATHIWEEGQKIMDNMETSTGISKEGWLLLKGTITDLPTPEIDLSQYRHETPDL